MQQFFSMVDKHREEGSREGGDYIFWFSLKILLSSFVNIFWFLPTAPFTSSDIEQTLGFFTFCSAFGASGN